MKRCEFCGSELPANAQFCGNCGRKIDDRYATLTDISNPLEMGNPERQTPPLFSSPMYPNIQGSGIGWQGTDTTLQTNWSVEDIERVNPQYTHRITDENDAIIPGLLLPGMLAMQGQMPSPAQPPMVQGTPQFGGVPTVQGTPATPGNVPQSIPGSPQGAASPAPSYAPQEAQSNPIHHQQVQRSGYQSSPHHYQPVHQQHPTPPPNELEHHHRHHTGSLHEHKPHSTRHHHPAAVTSKAGMGVVSKWIIIMIAALVIIGSSSILLAHALMPKTPPPVLSITGSNVVKNGGVLQIHGQGFQPGDGVTLTIDKGLPVSFASQHQIQPISQSTGNNAQVAGLSQMNVAGALQPRSANNSNITVSSTGTFDANVTVPSGLPAGRHTIQATDNQSSLSASLQFTIPSPQLAVNPTSLNFGSVEVGRTVKLLVTLSTQGGASLPWSAIVDGSNKNWLTLSHSNGVLAPNGSSEPIIVTANTNGLSIGLHSATLRFHSANGDAQTTIKINVISVAQSGQQAILNVSLQSLDFGQLQAGQQAQQSISIANLGNLPLQWQDSLDAGSATWLSLAATKGTVQPGAVPQTLQVKVDTIGLVAGSYSAKIHITSNGGNAQVGVTLVVTGSTVTPSPSPSPTTPTLPPSPSPTTPTTTPPAWTVSPTNLDVTNCKGSSTWTCVVTLTEDANSQVGITWTPGTDQSKVTFSPPGGTLTPGQQVKVTISSIPCSHANFTFSGSGGAQPVTALWNCSPTIVAKPQPTVSGINPASGTSTGGTPVTITGTGFIGATGVTFGQTPASNVSVTSDIQIMVTSPAGSGTVHVTVTTPGGTSATSSADLFTYTSVPPTWSVNPTSLDASTCGQTAPCQVTLTEDANSTGDITWSASSNSGATFKPQGGTLSPGGQNAVVSIVAPCQNDTFTFSGSGGVKSLTVSWTCSSPSPTLSPSPQPTLQPTPQPTLQLGLSFLFIPSMMLLACMTRFYEYIGRSKHRKRKPRR